MRVSLTIRNFTGPTPGTKSGPDVFADALVPWNIPFPKRIVSMAAPPGNWPTIIPTPYISSSTIKDLHRRFVSAFGRFERWQRPARRTAAR